MYKYFLTVLLIAAGCNSSSREKELLHKAAKVHNEMVRETNTLKDQLRGLQTDSPSVTKDSIAVILKLIEEWENDLVEVPGNDHHDPAEHVHNHDHRTLEITAEEMLKIQQEMKLRSDAIRMRSNSLKRN